MSKEIMTAFLTANRLNAALAKLVRPRTPPRLTNLLGKRDVLRAVAGSVSGVDDLVDQLESGARGMALPPRESLADFRPSGIPFAPVHSLDLEFRIGDGRYWSDGARCA